MKKRAFAMWSLSGIALLSALLFQVKRPVAAVERQLPLGRLAVEIESDKSAYQVGEPIKIRISIKNTSAEDYSLSAVPPWAFCSLTVLDANNQPVPNSGLRFGWRITTPGKTYRSRSTQAVGFDDPYSNSQRFVYWAPLSIWGYSLNKAGAYTIIATAKFTATMAVGPQSFQQFAVTEKSNGVRIKVLQ